MIHQPLVMGTITGRATDRDIRAREMIGYREELNRLLAGHTGKEVDQIAADTDRDYFMSAEEAKEYGLIDDAGPEARHGGAVALGGRVGTVVIIAANKKGQD